MYITTAVVLVLKSLLLKHFMAITLNYESTLVLKTVLIKERS
jgi:hypothetical protein